MDYFGTEYPRTAVSSMVIKTFLLNIIRKVVTIKFSSKIEKDTTEISM